MHQTNGGSEYVGHRPYGALVVLLLANGLLSATLTGFTLQFPMSDSIRPPTQRKKFTPELSMATPPFLAALYDILNKEDPSVIGWCDDGRVFGVYNIQVLETRILPAYYRLSKFASFQRQLNYFGFRKIITPRSSEPGTFYAQPLFLRDDPARMLQIKRKTYRAKGYNSRRSAAAAAQAKYLQPAEYFNEPSHAMEATEESKPRRDSVVETKTTTPSHPQQLMEDTRWPEFKMDDDDASLGPYLDFMLERDQAFEADSKEEYFMSPIPFNQGGDAVGRGLLDEDILLLTSLISPSNSDGSISRGSNN
ncbi:hypothetical protein AC1031_008279 [Aphanomyces cochlioides]|nr:hypothetical protein AC1031_008279 [Aphanomyces cochlioides]